MLKSRMLKLMICLIYVFTYLPVVAVTAEGDPWSGEAVEISSSGTTLLYASRKNKNAVDTGSAVFDFYGWIYTVEENPEMMAVKATEAGASWYYTIDVEKAGEYQIDVLGWSGWTTAEQNDGGGRFSFEIGGKKIVDGSGENPVILPPWGDGTAAGSHKLMTEFTDADKTNLGTVTLDAGTQVIKITADNHASGHMGFVKIWLTGSESVKVEGDPWSGEAVKVAAAGTTEIYASRKNKNALDSGSAVFDFYGWTYTVEDNPEKLAARALESGASWYYTIDVEKAGEYQIDVLGWSGWATAGQNDGGGRFSFEIGGKKIVDGNGESPVILPPWGDGTAAGSHKLMTEFTDADKTNLGMVTLDAGTQVIKITGDNHASGHMGFVKIFFTGPEEVVVEGEPWSGEPVNISGTGSTLLYAARKNVNALDDGAEVFDFYNWTNTVEENPENMAVKATESGASWYYTVNVEEDGLYQIDVLGWGGYESVPGDEADGRFSFEIGGTKLVDGNGDNPVILAPWGDGTTAGSNKATTQFTDDDKVNLGMIFLEAGEYVIKLTADNHAGSYMGFNKIWFKGVPMLTGLKLYSELAVPRGGTAQLSYDCEWSFEGEVAVPPELVWNSSDPSVCTVENGVVKGIEKGSAVISLQVSDGWNTFSKECAVRVKVFADDISLNKTDVTLQEGKTFVFDATVSPDDAEDKTIIWSSSNREVASVQDGVVTAKESGIAEITATCGNVSKSARVTVEAKFKESSGGGSGGGGGGFRYVDSGVISATKGDESNLCKIADGTVVAMDSAAMKAILEKHNSIIYKAETNAVSGKINREFFTEQPGSKELVFELPSGTVTMGADALNKSGAEKIDDVLIRLDISERAATIELSVNGEIISDFNDAVSVKFNADENVSYTVSYNESNVAVEYIDNKAVFKALGSGVYKIATASAAYADADDTEWATESIYKALEKGILRPKGRTEFGADNAITRGELAFAVVKGLGLTAKPDTAFEDVAADHEYAYEISVARELGIVQGVDGINFMPDSSVTRQDAAVIIYNALGVNGAELQPGSELFNDNNMISEYAKNAVYSLSGAGYLKGKTEGFDPMAKITKAETAVLLGRICGW